MKKALVLGILAIFAFGISTVNAQITIKDDPTVKKEQAAKPTVTSGTLENNTVSNQQTESGSFSNDNNVSTNSGNRGNNSKGVEQQDNKARRVKDFNAIPPQGQTPTAPKDKDKVPEQENNAK